MPYSAAAIANEFIDLAAASGESLTQMRLQKLVFFAHGWHLAIYGKPLLDEQVEAWKFGPVIRSLYRELRESGDKPIRGKIVKWKTTGRFKTPEFTLSEYVPGLHDHPDKAAETKAFLRRVWDVYRPYTAIQLSNMTHAPGSPWETVYRSYSGDVPKGTDIPTDTIQRYFELLAQQPTA
ncbi:MAG TPA: type II toxin-antitoxin system antitoxin SocA domain-containing protein [Planctomycetaceae bacterium]|jgi:uncharacterized phage-associated protein|nr:type II toxin-antitoxin system antitoxin SocA domain-containing protein [Planctomycetaceae bacterium]